MRFLFVTTGLLAALLATRAARAQTSPPWNLPAETIRLSNGLTVLLAPDPHAHVTSVAVDYGAGSADDPSGLTGLAHMATQLASTHTKHVADAIRELEAAGGCQFNATTTPDTTSYFESVPPERLQTVLWLESDRMGYAADTVTDDVVDRTRSVLANEDRDRHADAMFGEVGSFTQHVLFPAWHPYARVLGEADELDRIHARDVRAFLHTWYSPSNATLAIAGAFDRDATVDLVRRYFGTLPSAPVPIRPHLPDWTTTHAGLLVVAAVPLDTVYVSWRTPPNGSRDDAALDLAATALAGAANRRFEPSIIAAHLAIQVTARQGSMREGSVFVVAATLAPSGNVRRVVDTLQETVDDFSRSKAAEEIAAAVELRRKGLVSILETPFARASKLESLHRIGLDPGAAFDWGLARYTSVDPHEVTSAVSRWLTRAHRVVTVVLANREAPMHGILVSREEDTP